MNTCLQPDVGAQTMRELTDTELEAVYGGHARHGHCGITARDDFFNNLLQSLFEIGLQGNIAGLAQDNITVQIGVALFGGSVTNVNGTAQSISI
jgi:bacteriocin-like protein